MDSGIKAAWQKIKGRPQGEIAAWASGAEGVLEIACMGAIFRLEPGKETITPSSATGGMLLARYGYFLEYLLLWWAALFNGQRLQARPADFISTRRLNGGDMFFRGSHTLPLDALAQKFGNDKAGFLEKSKIFGGRPAELGDASVLLEPAAGFAVCLVLWLEDEEFPSRADILFDPSVERTLPLDVIWCGAMLSILAMLS
ncbi:MAG: DUF3786 domain-containing protein [Actinomycetota bacterium]|nr:DUF3786 domain-containing protein [Actinomycetota bacterium]